MVSEYRFSKKIRSINKVEQIPYLFDQIFEIPGKNRGIVYRGLINNVEVKITFTKEKGYRLHTKNSKKELENTLITVFDKLFNSNKKSENKSLAEILGIKS